MKKILGYTFIVLGSILGLALFGQMAQFVSAIVNVVNAFLGKVDAGQMATVLGTFTYWIFHLSALFILFKIGLKWVK